MLAANAVRRFLFFLNCFMDLVEFEGACLSGLTLRTYVTFRVRQIDIFRLLPSGLMWTFCG